MDLPILDNFVPPERAGTRRYADATTVEADSSFANLLARREDRTHVYDARNDETNESATDQRGPRVSPAEPVERQRPSNESSGRADADQDAPALASQREDVSRAESRKGESAGNESSGADDARPPGQDDGDASEAAKAADLSISADGAAVPGEAALPDGKVNASRQVSADDADQVDGAHAEAALAATTQRPSGQDAAGSESRAGVGQMPPDGTLPVRSEAENVSQAAELSEHDTTKGSRSKRTRKRSRAGLAAGEKTVGAAGADKSAPPKFGVANGPSVAGGESAELEQLAVGKVARKLADGPTETRVAGDPNVQAAAAGGKDASGSTAEQTLARGGDRTPATHELSKTDQARLVQRVSRAIQTAPQRGGTIRLRLRPPELGTLHLEVTMEKGGLSARLEAETQMARSVLLDNLPQLRERLAEQGIRIEQFNVNVSQQDTGQSQHQTDQAGHRFESSGNNSRQSDSEENDEPQARAADVAPLINQKNLNVVI